MTAPRCSTCGRPLASPQDPCAYCLLELGLSQAPRDGSAPRPGRFPLPDPAELAALFPGLEILELLGQGGMGAVYKARQRKLDRLVALKVLPPDACDDPAFARRFLQEARAMALLSHRNVVAVHDFGETGGVCWLLMEHVDGRNLRQVLESGELTPRQALELVPQMCDALQHAHDLGIVHRDIKPENVLLARDGSLKIADFGLAKLAVEVDTRLTGVEQVMGTPHYMAPEQMRGSRDVDHRADIYSLGVVVYEMLTGALPVGRFQMPSRKVEVDVRVDEIVLKALEHEPERRYQRAEEVKCELAGLEGTRDSGAGAPSGAPSAPARGPARAFALMPAVLVYGVLWAVAALALRLEVSTALQVALAQLVYVLGVPYVAWRWWTGRGHARGHAFTYGIGLALFTVLSTLALPWLPLDLLQRVLRTRSLEPQPDSLFVRLVCLAAAATLLVLAIRARRKLGVLPWSRFANFGFDLLIVLSASAAGIIAFVVVAGFEPQSSALLLAMPLFWIAFACDVALQRLEPRAQPEVLDLPPPPEWDRAAQLRRARLRLLIAAGSAALVMLAASHVAGYLWALGVWGALAALAWVTALWSGLLENGALLDEGFGRAWSRRELRPRALRRAAAAGVLAVACFVLAVGVVAQWERGTLQYESDVLRVRERFFWYGAAAEQAGRLGLAPETVLISDPGIVALSTAFGGPGTSSVVTCLRAAAYLLRELEPGVLLALGAALAAAAGWVQLRPLARTPAAIVAARAACLAGAFPALLALAWWISGSVLERPLLREQPTLLHMELEVQAPAGRVKRALLDCADSLGYIPLQVYQAQWPGTQGQRAATFLGAELEPASVFERWDLDAGHAERRLPAVLVEATTRASDDRTLVRFDLGRVGGRGARERFEALLPRWRETFEAELSETARD